MHCHRWLQISGNGTHMSPYIGNGMNHMAEPDSSDNPQRFSTLSAVSNDGPRQIVTTI